MSFDVGKLRLERLSVESTYHAAYQFWNLRGVLAERWGHGPIFGGYREGPDIVSLLPHSAPSSDERLLAVYGLRTAGLIAEGPEWTKSAEELAEKWLNDVYETLQPRRTTSVRVQVVGLYPVRDALRASNKLRERYYKAELDKIVPVRFPDFHAAIEGMGLDGDPPMSWVVGTYGPPHANQGLFTFGDADRDGQWWMCIRTVSLQQNDDGLDAPGVGLTNLRQLQKDFDQLVRSILPSVVD